MKSAKIAAWPLVAALIVGWIFVSPAHALRVNFQSRGDSDRLTFSFDSDQLPQSSVSRVGEREITVSLPAGGWDTEPKPTVKDFPGKLVESISATEDGVRIVTKTNAFGYIRVPSSGKPEFVLQIFRDPIGARWKPVQAAPVPAPQQQPAPPQPPDQAEQPRPGAAQVAQALDAAVLDKETEAQPPIKGEADLPVESAEADRKPFFAVPYSVRNEVDAPPGGEPQGMTPAPAPVSPEAETGNYPPGSELRFKAVNKTAEEVKFAELAGEGNQSVLVDQPGAPAVSGPVVGQVTGPVVGPVEGAGQAGGVVSPPVSVEGEGQAGGAVTPPPGEPVEERQALAPLVTTPEMSGQGQVGGAVAPPPPVVVEGAPPPEPTPEDQDQVDAVVSQVQPPAETAPKPDSQVEAATEQPAPEVAEMAEGETPAAEDRQVEPGAEGEAPPELTPEEQAEARQKEIRDKLYEGQSLMFNGALDAALPIFEDILKQADVPDDVREETLYAVADIKKQLHSEDPAAKFDEISQAFIEAMNANLRSNRVPRALLNLGLLNLQVGNFPEARAYFKILQEKYPDDDNIPSISYYWGEYFYKKRDYKKAADQFQYLIQTYPEHQLVKQAAYYLADSLHRTGFLEQAFQIVDYIDKRWPDYYMENMEFLRLAAGVEMQLGKWEAAKDHYFTYFNLNPDGEGAGVVLARLGDIYLRLGLKEPAKQVYEKTITNYPAQEGAMIAKMRLAEEGIYDDPAMHEMVDVFDRPYNLNPQKVYTEIVQKHPDSELAPIAQLKLAMWYAFNKKYPEALTAAQDLLEKYPDSELGFKARQLGDSVFVLAVPGMLGEERYARVVRYWETYDFIGKEGSKVDDKTRLAIATSYWKIGRPDKALEMIEPYLQEKQIPGTSDDALGLAVNIYLDQLEWKKIADLVAMATRNWTLKEAQQRQLDYARAMSLQNLGDLKQAMPMWAELAKDTTVDPAFRAYAMYYMAKDAMQRQDLRRVFVYSQEALALLLQTDGDPEKIKDTVLMSIYATERSGRYEEALKWAREYDKYIKVENPEWASTRFKLARIYRKAGAMDEWRQLLEDIIEKKPESLQAQLAKSALDTYDLEQKASEYRPGP
ncbi:tetratricopeptide repeat protein [Pseudodesulfovibrio portus]|uniref:tetratricopeptide repeat protein n=1 Tax=Pseudodesulfovibrio portus TaxID=231439 RepID=UPI00222E4F13|nr:tetratricopeptide repeat protein [Pseudodesulfovibrio portus]